MTKKRGAEVEAVVKKAKRLGLRGAHVVVPNTWINKEVVATCVKKSRKGRKVR